MKIDIYIATQQMDVIDEQGEIVRQYLRQRTVRARKMAASAHRWGNISFALKLALANPSIRFLSSGVLPVKFIHRNWLHNFLSAIGF